MKIIKDDVFKEVMSKPKSEDRFFHYSDNEIWNDGFIIGAELAELLLFPKFSEFLTWSAINYVPVLNSGKIKYWLKGNYQNTDEMFTSEQVFQEWLKQIN
jgi:hypothetical protein